MAQLRSYILAFAAAVVCLGGASAQAPKFYSDDPIQSAPRPVPVGQIERLKINALYDYLYQSGRQKAGKVKASQGTNTIDEVPDSAWFTNRHGRKPMSLRELKRGVGDENVPQPPFRIVGAKSEGITPGFQMRDARNRLYFVKPDPIGSPELSTGADVIGSKFFHAIGYNTPENYIIRIRQSDWTIGKEATITGIGGIPREMVAKDLYDILAKVPMLPDGSFRVIASAAVPGKGIGPFRYEGTRSDDPNDLVPHEQRRDLRGLFVFCAWLNHTDAKSANSFDTVIDSVVRHYLIDFGSALGSDGDIAKDARFGHEYQIPTAGAAIAKILSLGLWSPDWERARYPKMKAVGRIEADSFDPDTWKPNYPNTAFLNRLPGDEFWAAKIVMRFSNEDIRAIVETGEYSDPHAVDYLVSTLAKRRDKIGRTYFAKVLPLDAFKVVNGQLQFEDLAEKSGFSKAVFHQIAWSRFDNANGAATPLAEDLSLRLPRAFASSAEGSYFTANIKSPADERKSVTVFLQKRNGGAEVVGIERTW